MSSLKTLIQFHEKLNPDIWTHDAMRLDVRIRLLRTAIAFYQFLGIHVVVKDIVVTGSNAGYNYTPLSDIDVHLIVDVKAARCPNLAENLFTTKKALWSSEHDVTIRGHVVELYVEDENTPAKSNGVYSILQGDWIKHPQAITPQKSDKAVEAKVRAFKGQIDDLLDTKPTQAQIGDLIQRLRTLRQNGLEEAGEWSTENLTYKVLRATGYIDKLYDAQKKVVDNDLSLTEASEMRRFMRLIQSEQKRSGNPREAPDQ